MLRKQVSVLLELLKNLGNIKRDVNEELKIMVKYTKQLESKGYDKNKMNKMFEEEYQSEINAMKGARMVESEEPLNEGIAASIFIGAAKVLGIGIGAALAKAAVFGLITAVGGIIYLAIKKYVKATDKKVSV